MKQYLTNSGSETKDLAKKLAKQLTGVITLSGELGAGKTTFVQGFAKGLGIKDKIISPTFVLIRQHKIPNSPKTLFHIDLYRIDNISPLGLEELWLNKDNIILIEWAEKIKKFLPKNATKILIKKQDVNEHSSSTNKRVITLS